MLGSPFCRESDNPIMTIPYHCMKKRNWNFYDPEFDRLVEVYSCWGSYESREDNPLNTKRQPRNQSVMHAYGLGLTPGMVASGDSHVGYPGRSLNYGDPNWCQNWKGGLAAVFAASAFGSLIYGVDPWDPVTFIGTILLLSAVSLIATFMPARRATQVDPVVALRSG